MIQRQYSKGINCTRPEGYFEHWYADMWKRCINSHIAPPNKLQAAVATELQKVGADVEFVGYKYQVTFKEDSDYTVFVLRWS
jgi:hypothetical protein